MISLFIPTKDRSDFLTRTLNRYNHLEGKIFVLDASNQGNRVINEVVCAGRKNVTYIHKDALVWPSIQNAFQTYFSQVTDYVAFHGDDDYFEIPFISRAVKFLKRNNEIQGVSGRAYTENEKGKRHRYPLAKLTSSHVIRRLEKQMSNYASPLFSIYRKEVFEKVFKYYPPAEWCPVRIIQDEYIPSYLLVCFARIAKLCGTQLIRGIHDQRVKMKTLHDHTPDEVYLSYKQLGSSLFTAVRDSYYSFKESDDIANRVVESILKRHGYGIYK